MMHVIPDLLLHGYSPLPLSDEDGLPHVKQWNRLRDEPMHEQTLRWWFSLHPTYGLGVVGGYLNTVPIDFDTDNKLILRASASVLPKPLVMRRGSKGFVGFWRDPDGLIAKVSRKNFCGADHKPIVEVKVNGVVAIPPTLHRKTGRPYTWITERTLFDTFVEEHPIITPYHLEALGKVLEPWCPAPVTQVVQHSENVAPVSDKRMLACAMAAMRKAVECLSALQCDRNIGLVMKARSLGKYVHHKVLDEQVVRDALIGACRVNGYAEKHGIQQCHWSITSGFKRASGDSLPVLENRPITRKASWQEGKMRQRQNVADLA